MERHTGPGANHQPTFPLSLSFRPPKIIMNADGTGTAGKRDLQISTFVSSWRYAMSTRPVYAPALPIQQRTRTALTDVLLLADQGASTKVQAKNCCTVLLPVAASWN